MRIIPLLAMRSVYGLYPVSFTLLLRPYYISLSIFSRTLRSTQRLCRFGEDRVVCVRPRRLRRIGMSAK